MNRTALLFMFLSLVSAATVEAKGRRREVYEDDSTRRGSAANPNPAFSPPRWKYERADRPNAGRPETENPGALAKPENKDLRKEASTMPEYPTNEPAIPPAAPAQKTTPPISSDSSEPPIP